MSENRMVSALKKLILTLLIFALLGVTLAVFPGCGGRNLVAQTSSGKVKGELKTTGILAFKGIPYAKPPVGKLRFKPPQPRSPGAIHSRQ